MDPMSSRISRLQNLYLFFIETNMSRNGRTLTLTKTEKRLPKANEQGDLTTHYIHHRLENEGTVHWSLNCLQSRVQNYSKKWT